MRVLAGCEPIRGHTANAFERVSAANSSSFELREILCALAAIGLEIPVSMAEAAVKVERSLAIYELATASLRAAAAAPSGDERAALLDDAVAFGGFADQLHAEALSELRGLLASEKDRDHR